MIKLAEFYEKAFANYENILALPIPLKLCFRDEKDAEKYDKYLPEQSKKSLWFSGPSK